MKNLILRVFLAIFILASTSPFAVSPAKASTSVFELRVNQVQAYYVSTLNPDQSVELDAEITNVSNIRQSYVSMLSPNEDASWITGLTGSGYLDPNDKVTMKVLVTPIHKGTRFVQWVVANEASSQSMFIEINVFPRPSILSLTPPGANLQDKLVVKGEFLRLPINEPLANLGVEYLDSNLNVVSRQTCEDFGVTCAYSQFDTFVPEDLLAGASYIRVFGPNGFSNPFAYEIASSLPDKLTITASWNSQTREMTLTAQAPYPITSTDLDYGVVWFLDSCQEHTLRNMWSQVNKYTLVWKQYVGAPTELWVENDQAAWVINDPTGKWILNDRSNGVMLDNGYICPRIFTTTLTEEGKLVIKGARLDAPDYDPRYNFWVNFYADSNRQVKLGYMKRPEAASWTTEEVVLEVPNWALPGQVVYVQVYTRGWQGSNVFAYQFPTKPQVFWASSGAAPGERIVIKGMFGDTVQAVEWLDPEKENSLITISACNYNDMLCSPSLLDVQFPHGLKYAKLYAFRVVTGRGTSAIFNYGMSAIGGHATIEGQTTFEHTMIEGSDEFKTEEITFISNGDRTVFYRTQPISLDAFCKAIPEYPTQDVEPGSTVQIPFEYDASCKAPGTYENVWKIQILRFKEGPVLDERLVTITVKVTAKKSTFFLPFVGNN